MTTKLHVFLCKNEKNQGVYEYVLVSQESH